MPGFSKENVDDYNQKHPEQEGKVRPSKSVINKLLREVSPPPPNQPVSGDNPTYKGRRPETQAVNQDPVSEFPMREI